MLIYSQCSMTNYWSVVNISLSCSSTVVKVVISRLSQQITMTCCMTLRGHLVVTLCIRQIAVIKWWWCQSLVKLSLCTLRWLNHGISVSPVMILFTSLTRRQACIGRQMTVSAGVSSSNQLMDGIAGRWLKWPLTTVMTSGHWSIAITRTIIYVCTVLTGDVLMVRWHGGILMSPQQMVITLICHAVDCRTTVTWRSFSVTVITKPFTCCQWMVNITVNYCHHITWRTHRVDWL